MTLIHAALLVSLLVPSVPTESLTASESGAGVGERVLVLSYSQGVMLRVARCHMQKGCGVGNWVPSMRLRKDVTGYTAVSYRNRWMVAQNVVIKARLYSPKCKCWVQQRLQAVDWQRKSDSTGSTQRLEVDYSTARRLGFPLSSTHAIVEGWE